jgi:hypothetical protein
MKKRRMWEIAYLAPVPIFAYWFILGLLGVQRELGRIDNDGLIEDYCGPLIIDASAKALLAVIATVLWVSGVAIVHWIVTKCSKKEGTEDVDVGSAVVVPSPDAVNPAYGVRKVVRFLAVTVSVVICIYIGALFHKPILSAFDGVAPIEPTQGSYHKLQGDGTCLSGIRDTWPADCPTPEGFTISPGTVDFIYGSIMHKAWHWGVRASTVIYYDHESYYILGSDSPGCGGDQEWSYFAKQFGTRIHGKTGFVFDRLSGMWRGAGYCNIPKEQFVGIVSGIRYYDGLPATVGTGFERHSLDDTNLFPLVKRDTVHYWCSDGEVLLTFTNGVISGVETNLCWVRL